eukprot:CAMPEP_0113902178 /NCGR_PEP_ID=MMETSP0780_2-20120614/21699_1 /TAXON_ID=652834 /ORGANISM="Palpitomonas bilix" /LENGTH=216 /DNA_ID=CAMNT_0000894941 /DNA_START=127 /DNA_END=777 /DNA_ORIENTATION=- /assembly_acc=CAM_ASM_000599
MAEGDAGTSWQQHLDGVNLPRHLIDRLVIRHLLSEGYEEVAEAFAEESRIRVNRESRHLRERTQVRDAINTGNVDAAIGIVNEIDPDIFDRDQALHFKLQRQKLFEALRHGDMQGALDFAKNELAPRAEMQPELLDELEKALGLFAFPQPDQSPLGHLVRGEQRQKLASELNSVILASKGEVETSALPHLLKRLAWVEQLLKAGGAEFPPMTLESA